MKRNILLGCIAAMAFTSMADVVTPVCYYENFVKMGVTEDYPVGWVTYGNGAKPTDQNGIIDWTTFFPNGEQGPYYSLLNYGTKCAPVSCTTFEGEVAADQWLVSPTITLPNAASTLSFNFVDYNSKGIFGLMSDGVPIKVYISETGTDKDDFAAVPIYEGNVNVNANSDIYQRQFILNLTGYEGKDVHFAFVQQGLNCGAVGFTDIKVGNYYIEVDNLTKQVAYLDDTVTVDVNTAIRTPVACAGAYATLKLNGETVADKQYFKKNLYSTSANSRPIVRFQFKDVAIVTERKSFNYELTITPDYEGAVPTVVTGTIGVPSVDYVNNVVVEEPTATGCGFCPAGIASMEYYTHKYTGENDTPKAIGVAIHGYMNYPDPMNNGVQGYLANINTLGELSGLPAATFNRATKGLYPWNIEGFNNQATRRSQNKVVIKGVTWPEAAIAEDLVGKTLKVNFDAYNSYDAVSIPRNMSVIMIENDVKGFEDGYKQENYIAQKKVSEWASHGSEWNAEYLEKFAFGGELGKSLIPADKMVYQHVARGVWPTFEGDPIAGEWTADTPRSCSLEFELPDNVLDFKNTEVIVIITDAEKGEIVAADIYPAGKNINTLGVTSASESDFSVNAAGGMLHVSLPGRFQAALYTIDGVCAAQGAGADIVSLPTATLQGAYILKVSTPEGVQTRKVML